MKSSLRVCWFGIYDATYPRNDILLSGLRAQGVEIIECHADWKSRTRYRDLIRSFRAVNPSSYDVVYAAYPATIPTILAKLLTRKPVVMDAFYGMYDAVVCDRKEVSWYHPRALKLWLLDWMSALVADYMVVDTEEHKKFWASFPFVHEKKIARVPIGVQDRIFFPSAFKREDGPLLISFHGLFIPLQGVEKIVDAANLLRDDKEIAFRIIGSGQLSHSVEERIQKYGLTTIEQIPRVSPEKLNEYLQEADVILGIFGDTKKALRVVPNKVCQGMALCKPVITMDSPAIRESFNEDELMLIPNTPEAIAQAISTLKNDGALRERLAKHGYNKIIREYSPKPLGHRLAGFLLGIVEKEGALAKQTKK